MFTTLARAMRKTGSRPASDTRELRGRDAERWAPHVDRQMTDQALFFNMGIKVKTAQVPKEA